MKKYHQGRFTPVNPKKYAGNVNDIVYRSGWERQLMIKFDTSPSVILWNSEGVVIPYRSPVDGEVHRYFVDFIIKVQSRDKTVKTWLIEVKPYAQTIPPTNRKRTRKFLNEVATYSINRSKWEAANQFCKEQGWQFHVLTEKGHQFV